MTLEENRQFVERERIERMRMIAAGTEPWRRVWRRVPLFSHQLGGTVARIDAVRELAEKVMGWKVDLIKHQEMEFFEFFCPDGRLKGRYSERLCAGLWDPYKDANATIEVATALCVRFGLSMNLHYFENVFHCSFKKPHLSRIGPMHKGTFCEAMCQAALAAVRSDNVVATAIDHSENRVTK